MSNESDDQATERFTFNLTNELDTRLRDTAMILGVKPTEICQKALGKFLDAIESQAGGKFNAARDAIESARQEAGKII